MKKVSLVFIFSMAIAALANAQATRTWVSGVGDDVNPCSRTAPCKTFAGAISKTALGGIINCLDPGGFGAVTITKAMTIDCTGTLGSALSSGVQGIVINAPTNANIVLRALDINGAGTTLGTNGVNVLQAASVQILNCNIANYSGRGVETTNSSNAISLLIDGSHITNVNQQGVLTLSSGTGSTRLTVSNSYINNNGGDGIDVATGSSSAAVYNTIISDNGGVGFQVEASGSLGNLEGNTLSFNATGVNAGAGSTIRMSRNSVFGSTANGVGAGTGVTKCFSNNVIDGNAGSNACSSPGNGQQ
jgi:hypothetical protein